MSDTRWKQWDAFVAGHPDGGFMQGSCWARCREDAGFDVSAVIVGDDAGAVVGGAVMNRSLFDAGRHCFYYIQEGPLLPPDPDEARAVLGAIRARIERERNGLDPVASHLRIEPRRPALPDWLEADGGFARPPFGDQYREPRRTLCVDLRPDEDARLVAMKPKGRYNIRVARRHGVRIVEDTGPQGVADFIALQTHSDTRHGLTPRPGGYFRSIVARLGDSCSIHFAEGAGERLASALVVRFGDRATYFFGGSLDRHRAMMAPYLLHHEVMNRMAAAGCHWYDFWGVSPADCPEHRWAGISDFKRKFGGVEVRHVPTLDLVLDEAAYARFAEVGTRD